MSLDPLRDQLRHGIDRPGWEELAEAMRSSTIVVQDVFGEHGLEAPPAQDHHAVDKLGSGGECEPFVAAVRPRAPWRDLDHQRWPPAPVAHFLGRVSY